VLDPGALEGDGAEQAQQTTRLTIKDGQVVWRRGG